MKRRKMFLAALLIVLIVCQSVLPFTMVTATTSYDVAITSSSELFYALRKELVAKNIDAYYDVANFRIITSQSEIAKVTELDLSNAEIDDLTGLGVFSNVTKLNLTSNELTEESNLAELDKLPLTNLNLSSNEIESVNSIKTFDDITYTDITNQQIVKRDIIQLDISEKASNTQKVYVDYPDILLEDGGEMQAQWLDDVTTEGCAAHVNWAKFNPRGTKCELIVAQGQEDSYIPYKGLLTLTAKVEESSSKLYNTSVTMYYAIIDSTETGICFDDDNFYKAVKEQLTAGQYDNAELDSYGEDGTTLYKAAYDEAKILVIDTNIITNDIPSLILNDKKIENLRGLEKFIGLESTLDLSYNYIDSLERILELEENKEGNESSLSGNYKESLNVLKENRTALNAAQIKLETIEKQIDEVYKQISELDATAEDYDKKLNALLEKLNNTESGLIVEKAKTSKSVSLYRNLISEGLDKIYSIYEQEYRLTTLLPVNVYDLTREELIALNFDNSKSYANAIMDKVSKLEIDNALTENEKELLITIFDIPLTTEVEQTDAEGNITIKEISIEHPITEYFNVIKAYEEYNTISDYKQFIKGFKYVDIITTAMNYCLLERMNNPELTECLLEDGLADLYEFYLESGMDTSFIIEIEGWLAEIPEIEDGTIEDGTIEDGTIEDGTIEDGTIEDGTTDDGTTDEGTTDNLPTEDPTTPDHETSDDEILDDTIVNDDTTNDSPIEDTTTPDVESGNVEEDVIVLTVTAEAVVEAYRTLVCDGAYATDYALERQISGHFANATEEELSKFILLPRIKYLNITDNKFESLAGIENMDNLLGLFAYKNLLGDINDVDWTKLTTLFYLDLGYNQLSNISALEVLDKLVELSVSRNLLSGNFDFYLAGMGNLRYADFSHNQYSNIAYLVSQYTFIAKNEDYDNVGDFFANSMTAPSISFQYQTLSMNTTLLRENDLTTLQLPKIFAQCEEIDHLRTSFGETSLNGTVVADGTEVYLRTPAEGEYKACVVIEGHNGNSYSFDGIGYGTTCTIDYTVIDPSKVEIPEVPEIPSEPTTPEDGTTEEPTTPGDGTTEDTTTPGDGTTEDTTTPGDGPTEDTTTPGDGTTEDTTTPDVEYGYVVEDTMTLVNTPEITIKAFKENLVSEDYTVTVLNENREVVTDATILRTGYVVSIDKDGENIENLEVIVKGDVNGDGEVDALDTGIVRQVINDTRELVGVYAMAADVNSDGEIDSSDALQILKYRAAKINVF